MARPPVAAPRASLMRQPARRQSAGPGKAAGCGAGGVSQRRRDAAQHLPPPATSRPWPGSKSSAPNGSSGWRPSRTAVP